MGLSYELNIEIDAAWKGELKSFMPDTPLAHFLDATSAVLSVVHARGYRRIESLSPGLFGKHFAYMNNRDGGFVYLDTKNKAFLQMDPDQIPATELQTGIDGDLEVLKGEPWEGYQTRKVVVTVRRPRPLRWVLWLTPKAELQAFASDVIGTLFSCTGKSEERFPLLKKIWRLGVPLKGEVYFSTSGGGFTKSPVTRFALKKISLREVSPREFAVPDRYVDLRDPTRGKKQAKRKMCKSPLAKRLSGYRPVKRGGVVLCDATSSCSCAPSTAWSQTTVGAMPLVLKQVDPEMPQCLPSTYGSIVAVEVEQALMDDLRFIINQISKRLKGFGGSEGKITIDWLDQFRQYSDDLGNGDGLYCLLRDGTGKGKGLLDQMAEREVRRIMVKGPVPPWLMSVSPTEIASVMNNPSIPSEERFDRLPPTTQAAMREQYLMQRIGSLHLTYPESTSKEVWHRLLTIWLWDIEFDLEINRSEIVDTLSVDNNQVHLVIKLPAASGHATVGRTPSTLYFIALGASVLSCIFVPVVCGVLAFMAAVTAFLILDIGDMYINFDDISIDIRIRFGGTPSGLLEPQVDTSVDAGVSVSYNTYLPEVVHAITDLIISECLSHMDTIISEAEGQLTSRLTELLKDDLGLTFPPQFGTVPLVGVSNGTGGVAGDYLSLLAALQSRGAGPGCPYVTQVEGDVEPRLIDTRSEFEEVKSRLSTRPHLYGGFVISQNLLNQIVYAYWRALEFHRSIGQGNPVERSQAQSIVGYLKAACPDCTIQEPYGVQVWPAVPPRMVLAPSGSFEGEAYALTFFDDVRLCISYWNNEKVLSTLELQFAAQARTQIGFGGVNQATGKLDVVKAIDRFFDVYFDLLPDSLGIVPTEIQGFRADGPGFTSFESSMIDALEPAFRVAMSSMLGSRDANVIPKDQDDPNTIQRYCLAGQGIVVLLLSHSRNLYVYFGLNGLAQLILPPSPAIDVNDPAMFPCSAGAAFRDAANCPGQ